MYCKGFRQEPTETRLWSLPTSCLRHPDEHPGMGCRRWQSSLLLLHVAMDLVTARGLFMSAQVHQSGQGSSSRTAVEDEVSHLHRPLHVFRFGYDKHDLSAPLYLSGMCSNSAYGHWYHQIAVISLWLFIHGRVPSSQQSLDHPRGE